MSYAVFRYHRQSCTEYPAGITDLSAPHNANRATVPDVIHAIVVDYEKTDKIFQSIPDPSTLMGTLYSPSGYTCVCSLPIHQAQDMVRLIQSAGYLSV